MRVLRHSFARLPAPALVFFLAPWSGYCNISISLYNFGKEAGVFTPAVLGL